MKISFLEIFFIFWFSAIMWVVIEIAYDRIARNSRSRKLFNQYRKQQ